MQINKSPDGCVLAVPTKEFKKSVYLLRRFTDRVWCLEESIKRRSLDYQARVSRRTTVAPIAAVSLIRSASAEDTACETGREVRGEYTGIVTKQKAAAKATRPVSADDALGCEVWRSSNRIIAGNYETARSGTGEAGSSGKVQGRVMQIAL